MHSVLGAVGSACEDSYGEVKRVAAYSDALLHPLLEEWI